MPASVRLVWKKRIERVRTHFIKVEQMSIAQLPQRIVIFALIGTVLLLGSVERLSADVIFPALPAGSEYQLIFATSGEIAATSGSIGTYNTFATNQAALLAALVPAGVTWDAVVSTGTLSSNEAVNNAPSFAGIPVYDMQGDEISAGSLYSGSLLLPINYTQSGGSPPIDLIWTGSNPAGMSLNPLGGCGS